MNWVELTKAGSNEKFWVNLDKVLYIEAYTTYSVIYFHDSGFTVNEPPHTIINQPKKKI